MLKKPFRQSLGVKRAIKGAGGRRALARGLGITVQSVNKWRRVPRKRIVQIEKLFGVPRHLLAPDIFKGVP